MPDETLTAFACRAGMYAVVKHSGLEPGLEFKVALTEAQKLKAKARSPLRSCFLSPQRAPPVTHQRPRRPPYFPPLRS